MIFALELGPEFQRTVSDLSEAGQQVRAAASEGLAEGVSFDGGSFSKFSALKLLPEVQAVLDSYKRIAL